MAADALAACVAKASAAMILSAYKSLHVFHEVGFRPPALSYWWEMIKYANIYLQFLKNNSAHNGLMLRWQFKWLPAPQYLDIL